MGLVLGLGKRLGSTLHTTPTSGGLTMGPMGHVPGPPARGAPEQKQRFLVEMVQFVAFAKGIGHTIPSNQATLLLEGICMVVTCCLREGVI